MTNQYREAFLAEPHNNLGTILIRSGQLPEAIGHYGQALRIKLDYPEAQNNIGLALMSAGEFEAAVQLSFLKISSATSAYSILKMIVGAAGCRSI